MLNKYPLILGASGLTGTELIRQLAAGNISIRVTYREQADLNHLRLYSVEPFYADFEQPDIIYKAMVGVDSVITILPIHPKFEVWGKLLIDCAKSLGIKHFIYLSNFSVDKEGDAAIAYMHGELEKYLMESGVPYTIIRPSTYFQNILWTTITIIRQQRFSLPLENAKLPHIDMRDVAEALAKVLLEPEQHINKTYTLTGTESLSMFDVAHLISSKVGKTIRYYPTPLEAASDSFRDMGMIEWISRSVSEMYKDYATIDLSETTTDFEKICAHPPRQFATFISEHLEIFTGQQL